VVPGQDAVLGVLQRTATVNIGVVAGQGRVQPGLGIAPLVLELVLGPHALRDRVAADEDRAAVAGELRVDDALVAVLGVQAVGGDELQVVGVDQQGQEQQQASDGKDANRSVHRSFTTWVASSLCIWTTSGVGRRLWSLIRSNRAMIAQLARIEEPP